MDTNDVIVHNRSSRLRLAKETLFEDCAWDRGVIDDLTHHSVGTVCEIAPNAARRVNMG